MKNPFSNRSDPSEFRRRHFPVGILHYRAPLLISVHHINSFINPPYASLWKFASFESVCDRGINPKAYKWVWTDWPLIKRPQAAPANFRRTLPHWKSCFAINKVVMAAPVPSWDWEYQADKLLYVSTGGKWSVNTHWGAAETLLLACRLIFLFTAHWVNLLVSVFFFFFLPWPRWENVVVGQHRLQNWIPLNTKQSEVSLI